MIYPETLICPRFPLRIEIVCPYQTSYIVDQTFSSCFDIMHTEYFNVQGFKCFDDVIKNLVILVSICIFFVLSANISSLLNPSKYRSKKVGLNWIFVHQRKTVHNSLFVVSLVLSID